MTDPVLHQTFREDFFPKLKLALIMLNNLEESENLWNDKKSQKKKQQT